MNMDDYESIYDNLLYVSLFEVLIPYLNKNELLKHRINRNTCSWSNDVIQSLEMSIQRWYFPKLNNRKYNGYRKLCSLMKCIREEIYE